MRFYIAMVFLLCFFSIVGSNRDFSEVYLAVTAGVLATLFLFFAAWWWARRWQLSPADEGVFIQGVFRGNLAIVGLALAIQAYGDFGREIGGLLAGAIALLYNVLSVLCFHYASLRAGQKSGFWGLSVKLMRNPLLLAIVFAFLLRFLAFPMPEAFLRFGKMFTGITLPLAMISAGASFSLRSFFVDKMVIWASVARLLISPLVFLFFALLLGVSGPELGVLCIMGAAPAASAGYVMARALGGNAAAAANIIALTTILSLFVVAPPIALFYLWGWL